MQYYQFLCVCFVFCFLCCCLRVVFYFLLKLYVGIFVKKQIRFFVVVVVVRFF